MALFKRAPERAVESARDGAGSDGRTKDVEAVVAVTKVPRVPAPLSHQTLVRAGAYAWAVIGLGIVAIAALRVLGLLTVVVVPLILALFPAAVLAPPTARLRRLGLPPSLAALISLVGAVGLLVLLGNLLAPAVAAEIGNVGDRLEEGYEDARRFLASGPFGFEPVRLDDAVEQLRTQITTRGELGARVGEAAVVAVEVTAAIALLLFALFFYLKDGTRIAGWVRSLFPERVQADVAAIGDRVWFTIGAYIRGQLTIALFDATAIGIGLLILRVPLVLPLSVLVFFGALFPIVGAFIAGAVAVLVALATGGPGLALATLLLIVAVQQLEGHVLAPIVLGRATELHPLAVIAALTAGAVLLGVLGAFLAVPVAASFARAVGYLRTRSQGATV